MDFIQMARDLGKAIQAGDEYRALVNAQEAADNDAELQKMIEEFNFIRVKLSTAMQAQTPDEEKTKALDQELKDSYTKVMSNEHMAQYNAAKQELDALMSQVTGILTLSANGEDPETCDPSAHACGGECGSCAGCH